MRSLAVCIASLNGQEANHKLCEWMGVKHQGEVRCTGGRTVQGTADANVHPLGGCTCQGAPCLMDGPQPKASQPNGATPGRELFRAFGAFGRLSDFRKAV